MFSTEAGRQAFADESFREAALGGYYIIATVIFENATHHEVRAAMHELRGSRKTKKLHWHEMTAQEKHNAAKTVADLDGFHIVTVGSPVPARRQERARALCLTGLVHELYSYEVSHLLMESRTPSLNERDVTTVRAARHQLPAGAVFHVEHVPGKSDALFWAADIIAGAVRSSREGLNDYRDLLAKRLYEIELAIEC
ncbi:hypothetical protein LZ318_36905 [Saccharopolyspora indica]|uniref:hypothetical protein n=1 Tax=Saccharopolyspora indica TaxID=1229659 RepID=UPI0022EB14A8|nr:hypothetical protein [Saccharopolyspora indica]MDA3647738.1 hypothetical protein [Saccharopolyspora indica]